MTASRPLIVPAASWTILEEMRYRATTVLLRTGVSPMEYVTQWRLESAHQALGDRRGSVPEIAESLGYQSVSAFSRAFKKQFGRGPGEVRRGR